MCNNFELHYEMDLSWNFLQPGVVTRNFPWLARKDWIILYKFNVWWNNDII